MLRTWNDTHYKLIEKDWLYIATHSEYSSCSLICPGSARDGQGFSIHFQPAHIEILESLVEALRGIKTQPNLERQTGSTNGRLLQYPVGSEK